MGDVIVAFDDFIHGNTTAYSSSFFNALLGELETYAIQAIVESVAGSADTQFELQLETSGDGRNWSNKNLVPEVNIAVTGGTTASGVGTDTNLHAGCALVRLRITLSAGVGTPAAKVIVYVRETTSRAFEPRVLGGCVFWVRADLGVTKDGSNLVSVWADQSQVGDANQNCTQAIAVLQPNHVAVDSAYNGMPTLSFATQWLASGTWAVGPPTTSATYFLVGNADGTAGEEHFLNTITSAEDILAQSSTGTGVLIWLSASFTTGGQTPGNKHVYAWDLNGASSQLYVDTVTTVSSGNPGSSSPTGITLGAAFDHARGFLVGKIAEVIIYNRILSSDERALVLQYLGTRYGVAIGP